MSAAIAYEIYDRKGLLTKETDPGTGAAWTTVQTLLVIDVIVVIGGLIAGAVIASGSTPLSFKASYIPFGIAVLVGLIDVGYVVCPRGPRSAAWTAEVEANYKKHAAPLFNRTSDQGGK